MEKSFGEKITNVLTPLMNGQYYDDTDKKHEALIEEAKLAIIEAVKEIIGEEGFPDHVGLIDWYRGYNALRTQLLERISQ